MSACNIMRIVVAMSGGVDSSVAAALLKEQGHEVIGLAMKTHNLAPKHNRACCTPDDMRDARYVADLLEIPFYVINYAELFEKTIVHPFAQAYVAGETPNPCVECNAQVKFVPLLQQAQLLGADRLATGHYARIQQEDGDQVSLYRGKDTRKDQSYFLFKLDQSQLQQIWFPLGALTKSEVRTHAERLGLPVAQKSESQEICFVGDEGYAATVEKILGPENMPKQGDIRHEDGTWLAHHDGIHRFTIGQRKGLRIAHPEPLYVITLRPETNEVIVGPRPSLATDQVTIHQTRWILDPPAPGELVWIQQRYREYPQAAHRIANPKPGVYAFQFVEPAQRGAPGQAAVVYQQDKVLGGGAITSSLPLL